MVPSGTTPLHNVTPVDTSFSWRYCIIYTTLHQSIHLFPGGIASFTQRYTSRYIFFLAVLHHLHKVTPVDTSYSWRYYTITQRYTSRYILFLAVLHHYTTLYQSIHLIPGGIASFTRYTSRYIFFLAVLHHYTTLHQSIHLFPGGIASFTQRYTSRYIFFLAVLHHLHNVTPVDTSYSWRYCIIYTTLHQSIHLFPGGIASFTQRYTSRYILFLAVLHHYTTLYQSIHLIPGGITPLHNVIPVDTSYSWRYCIIYITLYQSRHRIPILVDNRIPISVDTSYS